VKREGRRTEIPEGEKDVILESERGSPAQKKRRSLVGGSGLKTDTIPVPRRWGLIRAVDGRGEKNDKTRGS